MNIIFDARAQQHRTMTGVGLYVRQLALSLLSTDIGPRLRFFESGRTVHTGIFPPEQTTSITMHNKLLNSAIMISRRPTLAQLSQLPLNTPLFIPNINFVAIKKHTSYVITVHDLSFLHHKEWFSPTVRLWHNAVRAQDLIQHAEKIICVSRATAEDVQRTLNVPATRIEVIYPGVMEATRVVSHKNPLYGQRYVAYVGAIEQRKNLETLFQAFDMLKSQSRYSDVHLVIAGPYGFQGQKILRKMFDASWKNDAHYVGYVTYEQKQNLIQHANVFVYPSFFEGFGFPPLEAMQLGVPVIASWSTSLKETLENNALLFNPHRPDELADALEGILDDSSLAQYFITKGLARAQEFTWGKTAQKTARVLSSLLS